MTRELDKAQRSWLAGILDREFAGGILLFTAAFAALVLANSSAQNSYFAFVGREIGTGKLHLSVAEWASSALLAIFFFVVGNELRHEIAFGGLAEPSTAALPVLAAVGGVLTSAAIFLALNWGSALSSAWALPTSTDIAIAIAVLQLAGRGLPIAFRIFLITLAVVNDLCAILILSIVYTAQISWLWLGAALLGVAAFFLLQRANRTVLVVQVLVAVFTWTAMHESGVHATIAGVAMGLSTRVHQRDHEQWLPIDRAIVVLGRLSAWICVPLFAFTAAGVTATQLNWAVVREPLFLGIWLGLIVGQPLGILAATWFGCRFLRLRLDDELQWWDVIALGTLASLGFTVAMLVTELAVPLAAQNQARLGILAANAAALVISATALQLRGYFRSRASVR